jgi:hypothetical protein
MMRRLVAVVAIVVAASLAGCSGGHNTLNTAKSSCFRAIGVAGKAAEPHGRLRSVDRVTASKARARYPDDKPSGRHVCLVTFAGPSRGSVVVVVVEARRQKVVAVHRR